MTFVGVSCREKDGGPYEPSSPVWTSARASWTCEVPWTTVASNITFASLDQDSVVVMVIGWMPSITELVGVSVRLSRIGP